MSVGLASDAPYVALPEHSALDPQLENARTDPRRFAMLLVPLALILAVFKEFNLEQPAFFLLACLVAAGFAVSYWLPFRFKQTFFIVLSLGGAYALLSPVVATLVIVVGLVPFAIVRSPLAFRWRVALLVALAATLAYGRALGRFPVPADFWGVFGAIFMFRLIVYLYDLKHQPGPARLQDYLSYFFLLPNYYFLLFPVIDFQTFRKSFFKRDIHVVAQQGIWWMARGATHLILYRLVYQAQNYVSPPAVPVGAAVIAKIVMCYMLYLRVSGQFHIIVGMLCLFGFDLPETNRKYFLANSMNDYWRRINIYWKEFMVKVCYFPIYFKLRRKGDLRAQLIAVSGVFFLTWFLHAYQVFWLQGKLRFTVNDTLFWTILGALVLTNTWIDSKRPRRRTPQTGWKFHLKNTLQIAATFSLIALLWSLWSADGLSEWFYFLRTGNV